MNLLHEAVVHASMDGVGDVLNHLAVFGAGQVVLDAVVTVGVKAEEDELVFDDYWESVEGQGLEGLDRSPLVFLGLAEGLPQDTWLLVDNHNARGL